MKVFKCCLTLCIFDTDIINLMSGFDVDRILNELEVGSIGNDMQRKQLLMDICGLPAHTYSITAVEY